MKINDNQRKFLIFLTIAFIIQMLFPPVARVYHPNGSTIRFEGYYFLLDPLPSGRDLVVYISLLLVQLLVTVIVGVLMLYLIKDKDQK